MRLLIIVLIILIRQADAQVVPAWKHTIRIGLQSINKAVALQQDEDKNLYLLGQTYMPDSAKQILLVKLKPDGKEIFRRTYVEPALNEMTPIQFFIRNTGEIFITGTSRNQSGNSDIFTMKINNEGGMDWIRSYNGKANQWDAPAAIAVDNEGNVSITGYETIREGDLNLVVLRYNSLGALLWRKQYATPLSDMGISVVSDDSCNVYIAGNCNTGLRSGDVVVIKYDSSGSEKWQFLFDGGRNETDFVTGLSIAQDKLLLYGTANQVGERNQLFNLLLNSSGTILTQHVFSGMSESASCSNSQLTDTAVVNTILNQDYFNGINYYSLYITNQTGAHPIKIALADSIIVKEVREIGSHLLVAGTCFQRPENTQTTYLSVFDSSGNVLLSYMDKELFNLLRIVAVAGQGPNVYLLGDDAVANAGVITLAKYELQKTEKATTAPTPNPKK